MVQRSDSYAKRVPLLVSCGFITSSLVLLAFVITSISHSAKKSPGKSSALPATRCGSEWQDQTGFALCLQTKSSASSLASNTNHHESQQTTGCASSTSSYWSLAAGRLHPHSGSKWSSQRRHRLSSHQSIQTPSSSLKYPPRQIPVKLARRIVSLRVVTWQYMKILEISWNTFNRRKK